MLDIATLMTLINQVQGTPYVVGGDSAHGTDCSGLASWVSNVATGRPAFGNRFHTGNEQSALLARGFQPGTAPGALVIGWNSGHTAVTLPDGTNVSSGEGGGVKVGGAGAYQPQFTHHMFLPAPLDAVPADQPPGPDPVMIDVSNTNLPAPADVPPQPPAPGLPDQGVIINTAFTEPAAPAPDSPPLADPALPPPADPGLLPPAADAPPPADMPI